MVQEQRKDRRLEHGAGRGRNRTYFEYMKLQMPIRHPRGGVQEASASQTLTSI